MPAVTHGLESLISTVRSLGFYLCYTPFAEQGHQELISVFRPPRYGVEVLNHMKFALHWVRAHILHYCKIWRDCSSLSDEAILSRGARQLPSWRPRIHSARPSSLLLSLFQNSQNPELYFLNSYSLSRIKIDSYYPSFVRARNSLSSLWSECKSVWPLGRLGRSDSVRPVESLWPKYEQCTVTVVCVSRCLPPCCGHAFFLLCKRHQNHWSDWL